MSVNIFQISHINKGIKMRHKKRSFPILIVLSTTLIFAGMSAVAQEKKQSATSEQVKAIETSSGSLVITPTLWPMGVGQFGETDFSVRLTNSSSSAALVKALALSNSSCFCFADSEAGITLAFSNRSWAIHLKVLVATLPLYCKSLKGALLFMELIFKATSQSSWEWVI